MKPNESKTAEIYPCADCGKLRSIDQGASIFTVCDQCWDKKHEGKAMIQKGIRVQIWSDEVVLSDAEPFCHLKELEDKPMIGLAFTHRQLKERDKAIARTAFSAHLKTDGAGSFIYKTADDYINSEEFKELVK